MQRTSCTPSPKRFRGTCSTPTLRSAQTFSCGYTPSSFTEQLFEVLWGSDDSDDNEKLTKAMPEEATPEKVNPEGSAASQNTDPSSSTVIFEEIVKQTRKTEKDNDTRERETQTGHGMQPAAQDEEMRMWQPPAEDLVLDFV